jgi:large subunit ribosomal protein L11
MGSVCLLLPTLSTKSLQSLKTTQIMAKQLFAVVKLQIKGGAANPAPPIGPALGSKGVNIMEFCKQFNARTQEMKDKLLPVIINVYSDKTFDFIIKRPPVAAQIKEMAKIQKGSDQSNRKKVGSITWDQVRKIAEDKLPDMNCFTIESAMKMVAGTARSMGVNVVGENPFNKN